MEDPAFVVGFFVGGIIFDCPRICYHLQEIFLQAIITHAVDNKKSTQFFTHPKRFKFPLVN